MTTEHIALKFYCGISLLCATVLVSCSDDVSASGDEPVASDLSFAASVQNSSAGVVSRAGDGDEGGEYVVMKGADWKNWPVYIHHQLNGAEMGVRPYHVPTGHDGVLVPNDGQEPLRWGLSADSHNFHAWTQPSGLTMNDDGKTGTVDLSVNNPEYEYFIGSHYGPVSYADNGSMVELKFDRLVCKITLGSIKHINPDHSIDYQVMHKIAAISFPHLPRTVAFDTGIGTDNAPVVTETSESQHGLSFQKANNDKYSMYAAPFSFVDPATGKSNGKGKFIVTYDENYPWDFPKITNYELDLGDIAPHLEELKAGEMMVIDLEIKDAEVYGVYVYLQPWNTFEMSDVSQNPTPGIYTVDDLVRLYNALNKGTVPEDMVYTDADGTKVIRIFNQINLGPDGSGTLNIPEGYRLDGMGHNVTGSSNLHFIGDVVNLYVNGVPCDGK